MTEEKLNELLDANHVPKFDHSGKRFHIKTRLENYFDNVKTLLLWINCERPIRERLEDFENQSTRTVGTVAEEIICNGFEGVFAEKNAPGYEAGLLSMDRMHILRSGDNHAFWELLGINVNNPSDNGTAR